MTRRALAIDALGNVGEASGASSRTGLSQQAAEPEVSALTGFDPSRVEPSDSADYEHTFYGILNRQGQFWSPMPFESEQAAQERLAKFKGAHLERTHCIIPVRVRLEAIVTEARRAETSSGSVHEGAGRKASPKGGAQ